MLKVRISFDEKGRRAYERLMEHNAPLLAAVKSKPPVWDPKTGVYRVYIETRQKKTLDIV